MQRFEAHRIDRIGESHGLVAVKTQITISFGVQNFRIRQGTTPLKWAAASGNGQRIAAVFEYGADYSDVEYAIYLRSNTNMVYFRALGKASQLTGLQNDLAILSEVTTVP